MRTVTINPALNGYTVTVGCRTAVFETDESLLKALKAYLKDPVGTEKLFLKAERHRENTGPVAQPVQERTGCQPPQPAPLGYNTTSGALGAGYNQNCVAH